jgi:hypothetical protein
MKRLSVIFTFAVLLLSLPAIATGPGLTYHGRLLKADGTAVAASVNFRIQIRSPGAESCLLWEETQTQDLTSTAGVFVIGINDGTGVRTDGGTLTFSQALANNRSMTFAAGKCASGTTYVPGTTDGRALIVSFNDGTFAGWEDSQTQALNYAPKAVDALQVAGFPATSLMRVAEGSGTLDSVSPINNAQYSAFLALINGTSTLYTQSSATTGAGLPVLASAPGSAPAAGQIWYDSGTGKIEYSDGTATQTLGTTAGAVTSVATGTGLTGGPITTTGTISLAVLGAGGTGTKVTYDTYGRVTATAALAEADLPTISTAGKVSGAAITSGTIGGSAVVNTSGTVTAATVTATNASINNLRVYKSDNSNKVTITASGSQVADYGLVLPTTAGTNGYILSTDGSGVLSWLAPSSLTAGTATNFSGSLVGDVTGTQGATVVATVGGSTAANVHTAEGLANAATNANTVSTIVKRDSSGNFSAGTASLTSANLSTLVLKDSGANTATLQAPNAITTSYVLKLPVALPGTTGFVLSGDTSGNLSWIAPSTGSVTNVTATAPLVSSGGATPNLTITQAATAANGYLSSVDWNTFNNKLATALTSGQIFVGNGSNVATAVTPSGDVTMTNAGVITVGKIQGTAVDATAPIAAGQILRYDGATGYFAKYLTVGDLHSSIGPGFAQAFPGTGCTAGETLTWSSITDTLSCILIAVADSQITYASEAQHTFLAAPAGAAGVPTYRAIASTDLPTTAYDSRYFKTGGNSFGAGATFGTADNNALTFITNNATAMTLDTSGRLGIGSTPATSLDVNGAVSIRGMAVPAGSPAGQARLYFDSTSNLLMLSQNTGAYTALATTGATQTFTSNQTFSGDVSITGAGTGLSVTNGALIGGTLGVTGVASVTNATASTSSSTGALIVSGGEGVAGSIYSGASINAATTMSAATSLTTPQIYGASTASGNISIDSTSNASKGSVLLAPTGGSVGIGTTTPSSILGISGQAAQTIGLERNTTAATAGNNLSVKAGGGTLAGTNLNGGNLYLQGGVSTGTGTSNVYIQTTGFGTGGGTSDDPMVTGMYLNGSKNSVAFNAASATGQNSVAFNEATASGTFYSAAFNNSTAGGSYATSFGNLTNATGQYSLAGGVFANADGNISTSIGNGTSAPSYVETVIGSYNVTGGETAGSWVATDPLFVIGNGTGSGAKSTAVTVLKNGKVGIGASSPGAPLQVSTTNIATSGTVYGMEITPTYNQASGTAANTDLLINRTETAVGSGAQNLIDAQVGGSSKFSVDNAGNVTAVGNITFNGASGTANVGTGSGSTVNVGTGGGVTSVNVNTAGSGNTIIGGTTNTGSVTVGNSTGGVTLGGATTVAANQNLSMASGTGTFTQTYTGTANAATITANSLATGNSALSVSSSAATAGTVYGIKSSLTGAATTNVAGYFSATGATNNYGLLVNAGSVGIGTTAPTTNLQVGTNLFFNNSNTYGGTAVNDPYVVIGPYASTLGGDQGAALNITNNNNGGFALFRFGTIAPATGAVGEFGAGGSTAPANLANSVFFNTKGAYPLIYAINASEAMRISTTGNVGIGATSPAGLLDVSKALSATPSSTVGNYMSLSASTLTDNGTAASGTATGATFNSIAAPTLAATNATVTTTNAYTMYLGGAPKAGTNETLTNSTSLYIASDAVNPTGTATNSYGLFVNAPSGATNNYAANFAGGNVGIGNSAPATKLDVAGPILSDPNTVTNVATTLDFSLSNTFTVATASGSAYTLSNMVNGGIYTIVFTDTTSRTYTFACTGATKYKPANTATTTGTTSIYSVLTVKNGANYDCYVTWASGYQ